MIDVSHWLGALITSYEIIGTLGPTPVRRLVDRAASLLPVERRCIAMAVRPSDSGLHGLFLGSCEEAWAAAAALSAQVHVRYLDAPAQTVLSVVPTMYADMWTGAKGMYKLEPVVADGGELVLYAPHVRELSAVHGEVIGRIGYHCRDYFLHQWERFRDVPLGVLAHSDAPARGRALRPGERGRAPPHPRHPRDGHPPRGVRAVEPRLARPGLDRPGRVGGPRGRARRPARGRDPSPAAGEPVKADLVAGLRALVAEEARVSTSPSVLDHHGRDLSYHPPSLPDAVVFPVSTAEVSAVLRFANEHGVPVVPFGAGSSVEGHVIPVRGGISLDLTRMDRILAVYPEDFTAVVQPGVMRNALNGRVNGEGLFFSVDPGADASLGGMAATNASGTTAVRYGVMRDQVLGLEVVLASGEVIRTGGRASKSSAGYGLTHLFVGSEGTLGVITELTVRLRGIPEHTVAARASFPTVEAACRTAAVLVAAGVSVSRVELLDAATVRAVNRYEETTYAEAPTLFLEFGGTRASVDADLAFAQEVAAAEGCPASSTRWRPRLATVSGRPVTTWPLRSWRPPPGNG